MSTTMSAPTLADLQREHAAQDAVYAAALDAGDAQRMIAARRRKEDLADEIRVAVLLAARQEVTAAAAELAAAQAAMVGHDEAATAAIDARNEAYRLLEAKAAALNGIEMDRMFARNRIEMTQQAQEAARQRLAQLVKGATGGAA